MGKRGERRDGETEEKRGREERGRGEREREGEGEEGRERGTDCSWMLFLRYARAISGVVAVGETSSHE